MFPDTFVSELDAQRLIDSAKTAQSQSSQTDLASQIRESSPAEPPNDGDPEDGMPEISEDYEIMNIPPSKYLCTVPVLAPPPPQNQTAADLAKAEETRELARANSRGWELMSALDDQCLYYIAGWWSYKFCYGRDIVQFHALPPNAKGALPIRDPNSQEYVLGKVVQPSGKSKKSKKGQGSNELQKNIDGQQKPLKGDAQTPAPPNTELQVMNNQRYLVQRMGAGTLCDLTGRDRTIEVQYHCKPGPGGDRIGWIKEITTCSYLMLVHTPRLCEDVAFLPPKETRAHPISCQRIIESEEELAGLRMRKSIEAAADELIREEANLIREEGTTEASDHTRGQGQREQKFKGMEIGGIVIGGNQLHDPADGQPPPKLKPPKGSALGGVPLVETLAKALSKEDGGQVVMMTDEQLEQLNLNPDAVEQFRKELEKLAGEKGWTLEVVERPGEVPEIRGIVEDDDEEYEEGQAGEGSEEAFFKEEL